MKITISSSGGTFRTIPLAKTLYQKGLLDAFYIPYHAQKNHIIASIFGKGSQGDGDDVRYIHTNVTLFLFRKILVKIPWFGEKTVYWMHYFFSELFDRYVASCIRQSDILFSEILMSLHTIRRAKKLGMITILDRGNSHIQYQESILKEEYTKLDLTYSYLSSKAIKKSLQEYEEADYISVISTFAKKTFLQKGIPEHKMLLIPPGININMFRQVKKEDEVFRIIYCGPASVKKGTYYLLEAFKGMGLKNAELWLIGSISNDFKSVMQKYEGILKHISYLPQRELYKYFSQGSVFVLPSLEEGFGKVVIEAMACGLPAIVTTNTCGEDVVRDGKDGFIVPIRDIQSLQGKILFFYEHPEACREMGQSAKERVREHFSEEAYANRFINTCIAVQDRGRCKEC